METGDPEWAHNLRALVTAAHEPNLASYDTASRTWTTEYAYANRMRIAKVTSSGAVQYYLADHFGSTRMVLDSKRNTVFSTDYEPFGKPVTPYGTEAYKYTGERHDDPTGFVYLRARQYDPDLGRFVSADPVLALRTPAPIPGIENEHPRKVFRIVLEPGEEQPTAWYVATSPDLPGLVVQGKRNRRNRREREGCHLRLL